MNTPEKALILCVDEKSRLIDRSGRYPRGLVGRNGRRTITLHNSPISLSWVSKASAILARVRRASLPVSEAGRQDLRAARL